MCLFMQSLVSALVEVSATSCTWSRSRVNWNVNFTHVSTIAESIGQLQTLVNLSWVIVVQLYTVVSSGNCYCNCNIATVILLLKCDTHDYIAITLLLGTCITVFILSSGKATGKRLHVAEISFLVRNIWWIIVCQFIIFTQRLYTGTFLGMDSENDRVIVYGAILPWHHLVNDW